MPERIPIALVGCGGMGRRHLRGLVHLASSSHSNIDLVAVCDINQDNATFAAIHQAFLDHCVIFFRDQIMTPDQHIAFAHRFGRISVHPYAPALSGHPEISLAAIARGIHVLCEKPLALTVRGCWLIVDAAKRAGCIVSVGENYRRDPINRLARALIAGGAIGTPRLMIETSIGGKDAIAITPWRHMKHAGTIVVDAGIHYADILRFYLGEVRSIYGEVRLHEKVRYNTGSAGPGGYYARWSSDFPDQVEPTGEDALYAQLIFESGAIGQWISDYAGHGRPSRARQVFGSLGSLDCPGDRNGRPIVLHLDDGTATDDGRILEHAPGYRLEPLAAELFGGERVWTYNFEFNDTDARLLALEYHELAACVSAGNQPEVTAQEGLADLALTYAPFEAGRLGRPVMLAEVANGRVDGYQREIDVALGLVPEVAGAR